jgi:hypothetical protein
LSQESIVYLVPAAIVTTRLLSPQSKENQLVQSQLQGVAASQKDSHSAEVA